MPSRRALAAIVAALAIVLVGCGTGAASTGPAAASPPVQGAERVGPAAQVLDFTATTLAGESFDGARLQQGPAILWFWAPF